MQRTLIVTGIVIVLVGVAWPWLAKLPFGRLPGDIVVERDNLRVYVPLTTMVIVSLVLSIIFWFLRR